MIVLDTNVVSELIKPPSGNIVAEWSASQRLSLFRTTTITQAEVWSGLEMMPAGRRRNELMEAADHLFDHFFRDRVLMFDTAAARAYAIIVAERRRIGRRMDALDAQIASIARAADAAVATRNVKDFAECGVAVIDPWAA